jgi:glycosyltransferase involved in cell wall biosynthesis
MPVRILNVIGSVEIKNGGTTSHVFSLSEIWSRLGHECHILCLDAPDAACLQSSPVQTFALGPAPLKWGFLNRLPIFRYGYAPRLRPWLKRNATNYDAIILNGLWNYTSLGTASALIGTPTPYFICPHGMLDPWMKRAKPWRHRARQIFWRLFESNVARGAHGIIFACDEERKLAQQDFLRDSERAYVVGYGVEDAAKVVGFPDVRRQQTRHATHTGRRSILFLGRIDKKKGIDVLLQAFSRVASRFPHHDLTIVGPDETDWAEALKRLTHQLNISSRVRWMGMQVGLEKSRAFSDADFFVLPSHQENFGLTVAEAMSFSLPVLITNKVNIWREIVEARAGIAVNDDIDGVKAGLERMCSLSHDDRALMSQNARRCFVQNFDLNQNSKAILSLIENLSRSPHNHGYDEPGRDTQRTQVRNETV